MLGRMFGHEFHALLIFQKFLIADDFAALFGSGSLVSFSSHFIFTVIILSEKGLGHPLTWDYTPKPPKIDVLAKLLPNFPAPAGLG